MYIYSITFVCHVQKCQNKYIDKKIRDLFFYELYFGFSQTLKDSIK